MPSTRARTPNLHTDHIFIDDHKGQQNNKRSHLLSSSFHDDSHQTDTNVRAQISSYNGSAMGVRVRFEPAAPFLSMSESHTASHRASAREFQIEQMGSIFLLLLLLAISSILVWRTGFSYAFVVHQNWICQKSSVFGCLPSSLSPK